MDAFISLLAIIGLFLSIYFFFVKQEVRINKKCYVLCDIHERISCTKVAQHKCSSLFGFSNALLGIGFYILVLLLGGLDQYQFLFWLEVVASLFSVFFMYLMIKIRLLCVVCMGIHIINFLLLWKSYGYL